MRFFFHYNKPMSKKAGKPQLSLHIEDRCIIVDNIICKSPTAGRYRKRQPFFVMTGRTNHYSIKDGVAYIG